MTRTGRPTKLTTELADAIEKSLMLGNPPKVAAMLAGVTERTYYNWIELGRADMEADERTAAADFFQRCEHAVAQAEQSLVVVPLARAAKGGNLRAVQFIASRRFGWTETSRTEVSGPDGGPVRFIDTLDDYQKVALREAIDARLAELEAE